MSERECTCEPFNPEIRMVFASKERCPIHGEPTPESKTMEADVVERLEEVRSAWSGRPWCRVAISDAITLIHDLQAENERLRNEAKIAWAAAEHVDCERVIAVEALKALTGEQK